VTTRRQLLAASLFGAFALIATGTALRAQDAGARRASPGGARTITWGDLVPPDYDMEGLLKRYVEDVSDMAEDDPRAQSLRQEMMKAFANAPVVPALNGQVVRLPGFPVPLDGDPRVLKSFLLVPYFGACIHVPPPPPNQIVHVMSDKPVKPVGSIADPIWVTGTMSVQSTRTELADVGYTMKLRELRRYR
jgi:hypothetical protein